MSSAIAYIIYGYPLLANSYGQLERSEELEDMIEYHATGVRSYYSGHATNMPAAFGVEMGKLCEGAAAYITCNRAMLDPNDEHIAEFNRLWATVEPALQTEIQQITGNTSPSTFLLWATT